MKVAALIPARKDSRRLPGKNWQRVGDRPLWRHAYAHAADSGVCEWIVISSDDDGILGSGLPAAFIRQPQFEQSYNVMLEVVKHADSELWTRDINADAIVVLQPTSPLRQPADVAACVDILRGDGVDAVVSVIAGADDIAFQMRHARRLEQIPDIVIPNGAIYAVKTKVLREGGYWYGPYTYGYPMPKERSVDIDSEYDLEVARLMWDKLNGPGV